MNYKQIQTNGITLATALAALALALVVSVLPGCKRVDPMRLQGNGITFSPSITATRAFMNSGDLEHTGVTIRVYDYLTGYEGTIGNTLYAPTDTMQYFTDEITYDTGVDWRWRYVSGNEYPWTKRGRHDFFGWLIYDAGSTQQQQGGTIGATEVFGGWSPVLGANRILSLPTVTFTTETPQFDFSYSNVVTRDVESSAFNPSERVNIRLSHLFSALSLTFQNAADIPVTLNSITIPDFPNAGSASINYRDGSVEYADPHPGATPFFNSSLLSGVTVQTGDMYNILNGQRNDTSYFLTWPAAESIISPSTLIDEVDEIPIYAGSDSLIRVTYTIDGQQMTAKAKFPSHALSAGKRHHVNVLFTNKVINVTSTVLPWDFNELSLNFLSDAITTQANVGRLNVDPTSCDFNGSTKTARMTTGTGIRCTLHVLTPVGATLVISMTGDTDYFQINPSVTTIDAQQFEFFVASSGVATGGVDRTIHLSFTVILPDGREVDANSELIDDNYAFIRQ